MQAIINSKLILPHTVLTGQTLLFGTHIYDILPAGSPLPEGTESIDAKGGLSLAWLHQYAYPWLRRGRYNGWDPDLHGNPLPETSKMRRYGIFTDDNDKGMAHRSKGAQKRS